MLKTLTNEDAFKCVDAAADAIGHLRVRVLVMIRMEPIPVRVRDVDSFWHVGSFLLLR